MASDLHLGSPDRDTSFAREKRFVQWLEEIMPTAAELYIVGDLFDFWFEYETVAPKGYIRLLGKLAELSDRGVALHIFTGNHDLWYRDYLEKELGATIYRTPIFRTFFGKTYYIAHGDGLGPGDYGYKLLKKIFTFSPNHWLFRKLHPDIGIRLAAFFSQLSRSHTGDKDARFFGEQEFLYRHSQSVLAQHPAVDYFIYGHRHLLKEYPLSSTARMIYLGDWLSYSSYLVISEEGTRTAQFL